MTTKSLFNTATEYPHITRLLLLVGMIAVAGAQEAQPVLHFNGRLLNDQGDALEEAQVQFWHTDKYGNYDHPQFDRNGIALETGFQYFGTANTTGDGSFQFRTYRPGVYPGRPITHIHVKVWVGGEDLFTSQLYFSDEGFNQFSQALQLDLFEEADGSMVTNKTIVIDLGLGGDAMITPFQPEGPYYPVVDFFGLDGDMTNELLQGTPIPTKSPAMAAPVDAPSNVPLVEVEPTSLAGTNSETTDSPSQVASTARPTSASSASSMVSFSASVLAFVGWIIAL